MSQLGFWDGDKRHEYLANKQDLLIHLNRVVSWEKFRPILEQVHEKPRKSLAGRKPVDVIIMFKLLILQRLYNLSDEQLEYQVNERLSFMRFLNLGIEDKVPDGTTVWLFREQLTKKGKVGELFEKFDEYLNAEGYEAKGVPILDATLIPVPKQQNTKEENEAIQQGKIPELWEKKAQKDRDARWVRKNNRSHYGYKNHINRDVERGFIREYAVSDASVHDSQRLGALLDGDNSGDGVWADSAYRQQEAELAWALIGFESHINERAYRNRPLTEDPKERNRKRSRVRALVEHVFGDRVQSRGGKLERVIGKARIETQVGLKNRAYNFRRYVHLRESCA